MVVSALAVGVHWLATRVDAIGRPRTFPWVSVVLLAVLEKVAIHSVEPMILPKVVVDANQRLLLGLVSRTRE